MMETCNSHRENEDEKGIYIHAHTHFMNGIKISAHFLNWHRWRAINNIVSVNIFGIRFAKLF